MAAVQGSHTARGQHPTDHEVSPGSATLAVGPWACHLTSLSLSFPSEKHKQTRGSLLHDGITRMNEAKLIRS